MIKHFDLNGKWLENLYKCGRGNGEVRVQVQLVNNPYNDMLEILDRFGKIGRYDSAKDYAFSEFVILPEGTGDYYRFFPLPGCMYLIRNRQDSLRFCIFDTFTNKLSFINPELNTHCKFYSGSLGKEFYYSFDNQIRYVMGCDGSIFTYSSKAGHFVPYFKWNLGKYHFGLDDVDEGKPDYYYFLDYPSKLSEKYVIGSYYTAETDNQIISFFNNTVKGHLTLVYNKRTKESYCFNCKLKDGKGFYPNNAMTFDGVMYSTLPPEIVEESICREWLKDEKSIKVFDNMSSETNAVIIKYYLK